DNRIRAIKFSWAGPLDVNIDGTLTLDDLKQFENLYDQGSPRADSNYDQRVDVADLQDYYTSLATHTDWLDESLEPPPPAGASGGGCTLQKGESETPLMHITLSALFMIVIFTLARLLGPLVGRSK